MAQQMVNGSYYNGSVTHTNRMTNRYAVVSAPFCGLHLKPQDEKSIKRRHHHWLMRKLAANLNK